MKIKNTLAILATFAVLISARAADDSLSLDATISDSVSYGNRLAVSNNGTLLVTSSGELSTPKGILIRGSNVVIDVEADGKILSDYIQTAVGGTVEIKFGDANSVKNKDGSSGTRFLVRKSNLIIDLSAVKDAPDMNIGTITTTPLSSVYIELGSGTYTAGILQNYDWNSLIPDSSKQIIEIGNFENNKVALTGDFKIVEDASSAFLRFTLTASEVNNILQNTAEGQSYLDSHENEDGTYYADSTLIAYDSMGNLLTSGWSIDSNGFLFNASAIPEPAEWAAIFGAIALGVAFIRRRK